MGARPAARVLIAVTALCLAIGGTLHASVYPKAAATIASSALPALQAAIFKGLWISNALTNIALAFVFAAIAVVPRAAAPWFIAVLATVPLAGAVAIFSTVGGFFAGYTMLGAASCAFAGAALIGKGRE